MVPRHPRVIFRCAASREAELKQLQEFKENLNKKLQTSAASGKNRRNRGSYSNKIGIIVHLATHG